MLLLFLALTVAAKGCSDDDNGGMDVDGAPDSTTPDGALPDSTLPPDSYVPDAYVPVCGNGELEEGEVCDDGNEVSGDGCNSTCSLQDNWDHVATFWVDGDQSEPSVACNNASFAAVWTHWTDLDSDGSCVMIRFFGPDGIPTETFRGNDHELPANQVVQGHQHQPVVAGLPSGSFAVAWTDGSGVTGAPSDIRMSYFNPDGTRLVDEILVNTTVTGDQQTPALAVDAGGNVLVVWADGSGVGPDTAGYGIRGRLFDSAGSPLVNSQTGDGSDFQINQVHAGTQRDPTVCANEGGGFVVAWADGSGAFDGDGFGITATVLDSTGSPAGPGTDFGVSPTEFGQQIAPVAVHQPGHGVAVFWTDGSLDEDLQEFGIRGRLLAPDGSFRQTYLGDDLGFQVNLTTGSAQELPDVASNGDGNMLVVWQDWSGSDGSASGIRARGVWNDGNYVLMDLSPDGEDFPLNTTFLGAQREPAICYLNDLFVVFWTDESQTAPDEVGSAVRYRLVAGY